MTTEKRELEFATQAAFLYDTPSFQAELQQDLHHYGEVAILETVTEPGMVALEFGSNKGVTTVALSRSVGPAGKVHAFEPVPEYHAALVKNLEINAANNVQAHLLALTDREGSIVYYKHGEGSGIVAAERVETITVNTISLDGFMRAERVGRVDFINMDCEGAELLAIEGGADTLQGNAPRIFCEIHHGYLASLDQSVEDIVEHLRGLGYQVMPLRIEALNEEVGLGNCTHVYAVKNERLPDIRSIQRR
jgi:FkbM family methyltransferase